MSFEKKKMFSFSYDDVLKKFPHAKPRKYVDRCNPLLQHFISLRKYIQKVENLIQLTKTLKEVEDESERNAIIRTLPPIPDLPKYEKQPESYKERNSDDEIELSEDSVKKILSKAVARILFVHGYAGASFNLLQELGIITGDFIKAIIFLMFKDTPPEESFSLQSLDKALQKKGINGIEGLHAFYVNHIINYHDNLNSKCTQLCAELENNIKRPENTEKCQTFLNERRSKDNSHTLTVETTVNFPSREKKKSNNIKQENEEREKSNKINLDINEKERNSKTDSIILNKIVESSLCEEKLKKVLPNSSEPMMKKLDIKYWINASSSRTISNNISIVNQESSKTNLEIDTANSKSKYERTIDCTNNVALDTDITSNLIELTDNSKYCVTDSPNNKISCQSKKRKLKKLVRRPKNNVDLSNPSFELNKKQISKKNTNFHPHLNKKLKLDLLCRKNDSNCDLFTVQSECNSVSNPIEESKSLKSKNLNFCSTDITQEKENSGNISDSESACIQKLASDANLSTESNNLVFVDSDSDRFPKLKKIILKKSPDFCFKPMKNTLPEYTVCNLSSSEDTINEEKVNDSQESISNSELKTNNKLFHKSTKKYKCNVSHNKKLCHSKIEKVLKEKTVCIPNLKTPKLHFNLGAKQAIHLEEKTKCLPVDEKKDSIQAEISFENKQISDIPSQMENKHLEHLYSTCSVSNELIDSEKILKNQIASFAGFDTLQESNDIVISRKDGSKLPGILEDKLPIDLIESDNRLPHQIVKENEPVETQNISGTVTKKAKLTNLSIVNQNSDSEANIEDNLDSQANQSMKGLRKSNKNRNKVTILKKNKKINDHLSSFKIKTINPSANSKNYSSSNLHNKSISHRSPFKLSPKFYLKVRKRWTSSLKPKKKFPLSNFKLHLKSRNVLTIKKLFGNQKANSEEKDSIIM